MLVLIGSRALELRAPGLIRREPRDLDLVGDLPELKAIPRLLGAPEYSILAQPDGLRAPNKYHYALHYIVAVRNGILARTYPGLSEGLSLNFDLEDLSTPSARVLYDLVASDKHSQVAHLGALGKVLVPSLNLLFTIKSSHRFAKNSPFFWKTAMDYHRMKVIGCEIPDYAREFHKLRSEETYAKYAHPKLNVDKKQFFTDNVKYQYDHDSIHEAVKIGQVPAYTLYKSDNAQVMCDKKKFFALTDEERLNGVLEEAYVLALERSQLPHPGVMTPKQSFLMALSKVCSSITSGFFREWAYENIFNAVAKYDDNYVEKFNLGLAKGLVKNYG